jgi:hypothetical protein
MVRRQVHLSLEQEFLMRKLCFILLAAAAILLVSCNPAKPGPAATANQPPAGSTVQAANSKPGEKELPTEDPQAAKMTCQVVSAVPTQGPTEVSQFPPASQDDWSLGNAKNPSMTVIEYSDFQ